MTISAGQEIVQRNLQTIYHLPPRYKNLDHYLSIPSLRETLLGTLNFVKTKNIIIYKHKYVFILDTDTITHRVRKKNTGRASSNRHINFLCALGVINKQYQGSSRKEFEEQDKLKATLLEINRQFLMKYPNRRPINAFYIREYDEAELKRLEERATRLRYTNVTPGNISFNRLCLCGLDDLATEVYPLNNRSAPEVKLQEYGYLLILIDKLISDQGYATKENIRDNVLLSDAELDMVFKLFKDWLKENYYYKMPTKAQKQQWNLTDNKFIFTKKEGETCY